MPQFTMAVKLQWLAPSFSSAAWTFCVSKSMRLARTSALPGSGQPSVQLPHSLRSAFV